MTRSLDPRLVDRLVDRLEIEEVLVRYTRAVDTADWDRLDEVFTPDATIDYTATGGIAGGYAEVKAWLAATLPVFSRLMHTLGQVEVVPEDPGTGAEGAGARVAAYFHNPMVLPTPDGGEHLVEVGGIYHHRMVRTADGWRSRALVEELVWRRGL